MVPVFNCRVKGGNLDILPYEKVRIQRFVQAMPEGTRLELILRKYKRLVTNDQRGYYWGVVVPILAEYFGHDNKQDMHEDLKIYFNPAQSRINPEDIVGGSTTKLSSENFYGAENSYVKRIVRWAAQEYGINIPDPDEVADL
jgi:hypothetical protein